MSLQFSYKQTEIGRIPKEWEVERLGDISNQRNEIVQPEQKRNDKFVGLEHLEKGETRIKAYGLASGVISSKFRFFPGDILYGKLRPYLDKAVIADFAGICSTDLVVIDQDKKKVYPNFLIYIIHSPNFISHAISTTSGTNHPRTSWNAIAKFKLGLPPFPEQIKIAEILSTVDQAIEKVDEAIEKTKRLKNGLMQELLTKGIGHKEFKDTEIGRIPKEWSLVRLEEAVKTIKRGPFGGSVKKEIFVSKGYKVYEQKNVINIDFSSGSYYIDSKKYNELKIFAIKEGDILLTGAGTIGKIAVVPKNFEPGIINQALIKITLDQNKILIPYFYNLLIFAPFSKKVLGSSHGATMKNISSVKDLKSILIPLPPLLEQKKIAEILITVDGRLELLRKRKEKQGRVKKGLMDDLLTGRKRVRLEV